MAANEYVVPKRRDSYDWKKPKDMSNATTSAIAWWAGQELEDKILARVDAARYVEQMQRRD